MTNHVPEATKPASGDYAWLGAEAGSVADLMYMLNTEDWYDAINSRFVSELLDDTLPESILKAYLIQDFKFYNNGMMARLIKLAPRQETKDMLAAQSQWFADNEATYFEHFLEAYHVSQEEYDAIVEGGAAAAPAAALAPRPHLPLPAPHLLRASWRSRCPASD